MKITTELFLAWKYFKPKRSAVSVITLISVVGVALGVAVLIVVLAVMTGFIDHLKSKLLEVGSHAQIRRNVSYANSNLSSNDGLIPDPEKLISIVEKLGGEAEPLVISPVLLQSGDNFTPKFLIGLDPESGGERINLKEMRQGSQEGFSLGRGEIMIGNIAAREYGLHVGNKLLLHAPGRLARLVSRDASGKIAVSEKAEMYLPNEYVVSGIFSFERHDFDRDYLFMNLEDADDLFGYPWGAATHIFVWVKDPFNMDSFMKTLQVSLEANAPDYYVQSWKEINRRALSVVQVEKNMLFFLLIFIVLVAAFSITNTLITTVIQKTREIGLLKAMGASSFSIMNIFILQGLFVGMLGTSFGIMLGCLIIKYRMLILHTMRRITGQEIFPQDFYQFPELPAHIVVGDIYWIAFVSILLCTLGAVIPAIRAAKLDPARALRYE